MTDLRSPENRIPLVMSSLAALTLVGTIVFMVATPKPTTKNLSKKTADLLLKVKLDEKKNVETFSEARRVVDAQTWAGGVQQVAAGALSKVTSVAKNHKLKLVAFRPQRDQEAAGLGQLPILISLDGAFVDVVAFTKDIEKKDSKLALNLFQVASADSSTDRVNASIGIIAYMNPESMSTEKKQDPTDLSKTKEKTVNVEAN